MTTPIDTYPLPGDARFLGTLGFDGVAVHLHGLADLALVHRLRIDGEHRRVSHEYVHQGGAALGTVSIVRRAGVLALVVLVHPGKQERAVGHNHDVLHLIGLEESLVLGPGDVLQRRVGLYVTVHHARHAKREVLDGRVERDFGRVCVGRITEKNFGFFVSIARCERLKGCGLGILTLDVEVGAGGLRLPDAVGDLAQVHSRVVGAHGVYDEAAVHLDGGPGVELRHLRDEGALAIPAHGHVARHRFGLARENDLFALQLSLVRRWHRDHGST